MARPGDVVGDHLGVNGGLENGSGVLQLLPQLGRVHQIAVVGQPQGALHVVEHQRLGVLTGAAARSGVAHVAHPDISVHPLQMLRLKHFIAKPHSLVCGNLPLGSLRIADCDAAALLPPVLQGEKPVIDGRCHVCAIQVVDSENPAFFPQLVPSNVKIQLVHPVVSFLPVGLVNPLCRSDRGEWVFSLYNFYWIPSLRNTSS